ncbi:MAG: glycosyltransferase family 2 protein [Acidobacteria bacterium]|nr:glycosyltransferase family 2 protein [Acidobacteriota bacterium]
MATPRVAAIVLNYNGRDITLQSLDSLEAMTYPSFDLVHVDNGSTDGSSEAVAAKHPRVIQIRVEENTGAANGMNAGLAYACREQYDYILALNNDIEVDPDMLTEMMKVAQSTENLGCVGPKAYYYWAREKIWSAGGIIRFKESVTRERGMLEEDHGQYDHDQEVAYINGCALLTPRRVVEEIGGWDPLFHLSAEDADWCMRMKERGYCCMYAHRARLWHMVAHTAGGYVPRRTFNTGRSAALFVRRYANLWQWITFLGFTTGALVWAFFRELPKGNQMAAIKKAHGVLVGLKTKMAQPPGLAS